MRVLARRPAMLVYPAVAIFLALAISDLSVNPMPPGSWERAADATLAATGIIHRDAEQAIFVGGIVVSRSRHTIAGAAMGCVAGAAMGATTAAVVGLVTGGAALAAVPPAAVVGCAIGAASGAAFGYPLDTWALELE